MEISVPFEYKRADEFAPFINSAERGLDLQIVFYPVDNPWIECDRQPGISFYLDFDLEKDGEHYLGYHINRDNCHAWMTCDGKNMRVYYLKDHVRYFRTERQIFGAVCVEYVLSMYSGFVLHSSFVSWNNYGILFSAPSGTGKSTQASLWEKYEQAEILNGDRTALRFTDNAWYAYGMPYAGSSAIYRNESRLIAAIVVLDQGPENILEKMNKIQAYRAIYSQLTLHPWDTAFMERVLGYLNTLIEHIPVYHLTCRPDKGAVELLKKELEENIIAG